MSQRDVQAPLSLILPAAALLALLGGAHGCGGLSPSTGMGSGGAGGQTSGGTGGEASGGTGGEASGAAGGGDSGSDGGGSGGADAGNPAGSGGDQGGADAGTGGVGSGGSSGTGGAVAPIAGCEDCAKFDRCCDASGDAGLARGCMLTAACNMSTAGVPRDFLVMGCKTQLQQLAAMPAAPAVCK